MNPVQVPMFHMFLRPKHLPGCGFVRRVRRMRPIFSCAIDPWEPRRRCTLGAADPDIKIEHEWFYVCHQLLLCFLLYNHVLINLYIYI